MNYTGGHFYLILVGQGKFGGIPNTSYILLIFLVLETNLFKSYFLHFD
jgi:hypothetical protein